MAKASRRSVKSKGKAKAKPRAKQSAARSSVKSPKLFTSSKFAKFDDQTPRGRLLARRSELTPEWVAQKSIEACAKLCKLIPKLWPELVVATYRPMAQETQVGLLDPWLRASHARLCFPRLVDKKGNMQLAEVKSEAHWRFNDFGIQEPSHAAERVAAPDVDIILVPCVGVTAKGHRVGMGKGYYDRILKDMPHALKIVVAFDYQLVSKLPQAKWDQVVDWVITERREIRTPRVEAWLKRRQLALRSGRSR